MKHKRKGKKKLRQRIQNSNVTEKNNKEKKSKV